MIFEINQHTDGIWLCSCDRCGNVKKLAKFVSKEEAEIFVETLNLAKGASHEHGRNGI